MPDDLAFQNLNKNSGTAGLPALRIIFHPCQILEGSGKNNQSAGNARYNNIMKTVLLSAALCFGAFSLASAQDFATTQSGTPLSIPIATDDRQAPSVTPEPKKAIDGVIAKAARSGNPLQMINPRAPKRYGDGDEVVSRDPAKPRANPEGIILLGFNF